MSEDESSWKDRALAAVRGASRRGLRKTTAELKARLAKIQCRALDELVSRVVQRPVRTTPEEVLGKKRRIESPRPVESSDVQEARRPPEAAAPETVARAPSSPPTAPPPAVAEAAERTSEARRKKKKKKRKRKTPPAVASVHLLPRAGRQVLATWSVNHADAKVQAGQAFVDVRLADDSHAAPIATWRIQQARGESFLQLPNREGAYVAQVRFGEGVAATSTPVRPWTDDTSRSEGDTPRFTRLGNGVATPVDALEGSPSPMASAAAIFPIEELPSSVGMPSSALPELPFSAQSGGLPSSARAVGVSSSAAEVKMDLSESLPSSQAVQAGLRGAGMAASDSEASVVIASSEKVVTPKGFATFALVVPESQGAEDAMPPHRPTPTEASTRATPGLDRSPPKAPRTVQAPVEPLGVDPADPEIAVPPLPRARRSVGDWGALAASSEHRSHVPSASAEAPKPATLMYRSAASKPPVVVPTARRLFERPLEPSVPES